MTLEASGTQKACFIWTVNVCKLSSKQMFNSLFSLHHSFACKVFKEKFFISQRDKKEKGLVF